MPRKLTEAQGKELLEKTERRQRLLQEARTRSSARLEELDIEISEKLGRQLYLEHLELSGELDLPENSTARQYIATKTTARKSSQKNKAVLQLANLSLKPQIDRFLFTFFKDQQTNMSRTADEKAAKKGKSIINLIKPDEKDPGQEEPKPAPAAGEINLVDQDESIEGVEYDPN
jgi:hypothetical protein